MISSEGGKNMAAAAWSRMDDKIFEEALAKYPNEVRLNEWEKIAECLPGKSVEDVVAHYDALLDDLTQIEADVVEVPSYPELTITRTSAGAGANASERNKSKSWTIEEHMLFLRGLEIYGKSDWRSISRHLVISRKPCQVASHAQKFFKRQKASKKERKRGSIHDVTTPSAHVCNLNPNYYDNDDNNNINAIAASNSNVYTDSNNTLDNMDYDFYNNNDDVAAYSSNSFLYMNMTHDTTLAGSGSDLYMNTNTQTIAAAASNLESYVEANTNSTFASTDCYYNDVNVDVEELFGANTTTNTLPEAVHAPANSPFQPSPAPHESHDVNRYI